MRFNAEQKSDYLIVQLLGELDHHYAAEIREEIDNIVQNVKVRTLIFDFSKVTFMDSSGIGVIMGRYKLMQSFGGAVIVADVNPRLKKLWDVSGLRKIIPEFETVDEAIGMGG